MCGLPSNMKSSSHKMWQATLIFLKPLQIQNPKRKSGGTWHIMSPPVWKSEGDTSPVSPTKLRPRAMHFMGRSMDCTLEDNMVDGLFFCATLTGCRRGHTPIVDLTFRITTCRSLLAIAFRTWNLVCINLSFASRDFVCPRMTSIRIAWFVFVHRRGHHAFKKSSCVSLAHGQRWLFLLSRHRKAFLLLLIRSLL